MKKVNKLTKYPEVLKKNKLLVGRLVAFVRLSI